MRAPVSNSTHRTQAVEGVNGKRRGRGQKTEWKTDTETA